MESSIKHNYLTNKCSKRFVKWYEEIYAVREDINDNGRTVNYMPFAMAYGVYGNFFEEIYDRYIEIYSNASGWGFMITKGGFNGTTIWEIENDIFYETLDEVRIAAVKHMNQRCKGK